MDRTGKRHVGCPNDDYRLIVIIRSAYVLLAKLMAIVVCCPVRRFVVTLRLHKRRVAIVSLGHQTQRRIAFGMAITPRLAHSMLRLLGVSEA
jgi:uncharacterized membrane protein